MWQLMITLSQRALAGEKGGDPLVHDPSTRKGEKNSRGKMKQKKERQIKGEKRRGTRKKRKKGRSTAKTNKKTSPQAYKIRESKEIKRIFLDSIIYCYYFI